MGEQEYQIQGSGNDIREIRSMLEKQGLNCTINGGSEEFSPVN